MDHSLVTGLTRALRSGSGLGLISMLCHRDAKWARLKCSPAALLSVWGLAGSDGDMKLSWLRRSWCRGTTARTDESHSAVSPPAPGVPRSGISHCRNPSEYRTSPVLLPPVELTRIGCVSCADSLRALVLRPLVMILLRLSGVGVRRVPAGLDVDCFGSSPRAFSSEGERVVVFGHRCPREVMKSCHGYPW